MSARLPAGQAPATRGAKPSAAGRLRALLEKFGPILGSLAIAMALWLVVHNLDRSPARFSVPITYEAGPGVIVLSDRVTEVELQVRATKPKLRTLQATAFVVRVKHVSGRLGRESVVLDASDVEAPFGVVVERVTPSQFSITYDRRTQMEVPVRLDIHGRPADGHEVATADITIKPTHVVVSGPESLFDDQPVVRTERIDVSERRDTLKLSRVTLIAPGPSFSLEPGVDVDVQIPIQPIRARRTFDDVPVNVLEGEWRVSKPNPARLRILVEGDEGELAALPQSGVRATIDTSGLAPRDEDYRLEPEIEIDAARCPSCKVVTRSQARVDITVKAARRPGWRRSQ